jgi:raffinose/stachyose/melibiose transport system substrate-binding protein
MKKLFVLGVIFTLLVTMSMAVTVEMWSWRVQDEEVWQEVEKRLQAQGEDIQIEYRGFLPTEYDSKMLMALQGGKGPDLVYTRRLPGGRTKAMVDAGLILPLTEEINYEHFTEGVLNNITQDGQQYGVPFAIQVVGIFYNKDIFDEYGLEEPKTWDELIEIAEVLQSNGIDPFFVPGKEAWALVMQHAMCGVSVLGPGWIKRLTEGKIDFLDQDWIYMNTLLDDLKKYYQKNFMANIVTDMDAAFAFGQAGMVFYGIWGAQMWEELNPDINIGYFMVPPDFVGNQPYAYVYMDGAIGLSKNADNKEAALKVLEFAATPEFGTIFSNVTKNIPAVTGAEMPDVAILREANEVANNYASPYVYWVGSELVTGQPSLYSDILSPGMQAMYSDEITPTELAQECQDGLSQWYQPLIERLESMEK